MADPTIPTDLTSPVPDAQDHFKQAAQGAQVEHDLLSENRTQTIMARRGREVWIAPGGQRRDATPHMHVRYNMSTQADILGNPEKILTQEWVDTHPGFKYQWPIREADDTASLIRAGWYVPVPFDAIDTECPFAMISELATPKGSYVVWKRHVLVAIPPKYWYELVDKNESFAIQRTVTSGRVAEDDLNSKFAKGGYRAEVSSYANRREQGISDVDRSKD